MLNNKQRLSTAEARLIEMFLAGAKPDKYRQRGVEIENNVGNVNNLTIDWSSVPQDVFDLFKRNEITLEDVYQRTLLAQTKEKAPSENEGA